MYLFPFAPSCSCNNYKQQQQQSLPVSAPLRSSPHNPSCSRLWLPLFSLLLPAAALSHFSDSILEYLANLDKAPDPTVRKDTFSSEIYAAYDILFNSWLQSRESKVRPCGKCVARYGGCNMVSPCDCYSDGRSQDFESTLRYASAVDSY